MDDASRVLVCGGRHYRHWRYVFQILNAQHKHYPIGCIIVGGCSGADQFAADWAHAGPIRCEKYMAEWADGPSAGPARNQRMLNEGKPDLVIAFPGGRGTADMVRRAKEAGVAVKEIPEAQAA